MAERSKATHASKSVSHVDENAVRDAFRRGWLGNGALRREDAQKVDELVLMLGEVARMAAKIKIGSDPLVVVDACAGKGALGVLASALVLQERPHVVHVIERDSKYGKRCLDAVHVLDRDSFVSFHAGEVAARDAWPARTDLVLALHACGGASDDVIDTAIDAGARAILLVPCCYGAGPRHEGAGLDVRAQPLADAWLARVPLPQQHALIGRRMAQSFIDAERTLRLEAAGYETEVVEVFPQTLSPHNLLWRARRVKEPVRMKRAVERLAALRSPESTPSTR